MPAVPHYVAISIHTATLVVYDEGRAHAWSLSALGRVNEDNDNKDRAFAMEYNC